MEKRQLRQLRRLLAQVALDLVAEVMEINRYFAHAGLLKTPQVRAGEGDVQKREQRLGKGVGDRAKPDALPGAQQNRPHSARFSSFPFSVSRLPPSASRLPSSQTMSGGRAGSAFRPALVQLGIGVGNRLREVEFEVDEDSPDVRGVALDFDEISDRRLVQAHDAAFEVPLLPPLRVAKAPLEAQALEDAFGLAGIRDLDLALLASLDPVLETGAPLVRQDRASAGPPQPHRPAARRRARPPRRRRGR